MDKNRSKIISKEVDGSDKQDNKQENEQNQEQDNEQDSNNENTEQTENQNSDKSKRQGDDHSLWEEAFKEQDNQQGSGRKQWTR